MPHYSANDHATPEMARQRTRAARRSLHAGADQSSVTALFAEVGLPLPNFTDFPSKRSSTTSTDAQRRRSVTTLRKSLIQDTTPCSPIDALPTELLGEIFLFCLASSNTYQHFTTPDPHSAPLLLIQICSHWRQIALSIPALWSSISAVQNRRRTPAPELVRTWLDRSSPYSAPLDFELQPLKFQEIRLMDDSHTDDILGMFIAHVHRWRVVSLKLNDRLVKMFLGVRQESAGRLEGLNVDATCCKRDVMEELPGRVMSFPRLRRLQWRSVLPPASLLDAPWHRLTHISIICRLSISQAAAILSQCEQAVEITLSKILYDVQGPPTQNSTSTIHLPNLLALNLESWCDTTSLIQSLSLPSLRSLVLTHVSPSTSTRLSPQTLDDFLARSRDTRELGIIDMDALEPLAVAYLALPSVRRIPDVHVHSKWFSEDVGEAWSAASGGEGERREVKVQGEMRDHVGWTTHASGDVARNWKWRAACGMEGYCSPGVSLYPPANFIG